MAEKMRPLSLVSTKGSLPYRARSAIARSREAVRQRRGQSSEALQLRLLAVRPVVKLSMPIEGEPELIDDFQPNEVREPLHYVKGFAVILFWLVVGFSFVFHTGGG